MPDATSKRHSSQLVFISVLVLTFGCTSQAPSSVELPTGGDGDSGMNGGDGNTDGGQGDGSMDGGEGDGSMDGGEGDGGMDGGEEPTAGIECDTEKGIRFRVGRGNTTAPFDQPVALVTDGNDFVAAWSHVDERTFQRDIRVRRLSPGGAVSGDRKITDDTVLDLNPVIVKTDTGFLLAWSNNADGNYDIVTQQLDSSLNPVGSASKLTTSVLGDTTPTMLRINSSQVLVGWVEGDVTATGRTQLVSHAGVKTGATNAFTNPAEDIPSFPLFFADSSSTRAAYQEANNVHIIGLDAAGKTTGSTNAINTNPRSISNYHVASDGSAAVYSAFVSGKSQVWFRLVSDGVATGGETLVSKAGTHGTDARVEPFLGGYLVTYRAYDNGDEFADLSVALLDNGGKLIGDPQPVSIAPTSGARISTAVANDGTLIFAWPEIVSGSQIDYVAFALECSIP